jgi:hypothetical protein
MIKMMMMMMMIMIVILINVIIKKFDQDRGQENSKIHKNLTVYVQGMRDVETNVYQ